MQSAAVVVLYCCHAEPEACFLLCLWCTGLSSASSTAYWQSSGCLRVPEKGLNPLYVFNFLFACAASPYNGAALHPMKLCLAQIRIASRDLSMPWLLGGTCCFLEATTSQSGSGNLTRPQVSLKLRCVAIRPLLLWFGIWPSGVA